MVCGLVPSRGCIWRMFCVIHFLVLTQVGLDFFQKGGVLVTTLTPLGGKDLGREGEPLKVKNQHFFKSKKGKFSAQKM